MYAKLVFSIVILGGLTIIIIIKHVVHTKEQGVTDKELGARSIKSSAYARAPTKIFSL